MSEPIVLASVTSPPAGSGASAPALRSGVWSRLRRDPSFWLGAPIVLLFLALAAFPAPFAGIFGHGNPRACELTNSKGLPDLAAGHPFGFTVQGCDLFASVVFGARTSIAVGLTVTLLTTAIALTLGLIAGYYGGWVDALTSRLSEIVFALPLLLGAILVLNSVETRSVLVLSLVIAAFAWPTLMRIMRSGALSVRERSYIAAARALGLRDWRLILVHVLPNTIGPAIVLATLQIGGVISAEATLTFLGIGFQPPAISWGLQLSTAQSFFQTAPHLLLFPAIALVLTVGGFVALGESLRRALRTGTEA